VTRRRSIALRWLVWSGMLVLTTVVLHHVRDQIEQSHIVLVLLLVVLGGSMEGGRPLGFTLACASFAVIDYFFQPPYDSLSVHKTQDWVVLVSFLVTAGVTTELLSRSRQEAALARRRAGEVESLARLGAATLRRAEPIDALVEIATLVRETLDLAVCAVFVRDGDGTLELVASSVSDEVGQRWTGELERDAAQRALAEGRDVTFDPHTFALPLHAEERVTGVMVVRREPMLSLDVARRRFLYALAYYAALGLERMRLVGEAAHAAALIEANRTKDQILASVSHDLRTPLTTIKVLAQRIEARGEQSAGAIVEQADRLARMVADLLELSRLRVGRYERGRELNTAEDVIGAALRRAQGVLGDRTIVPHIDLGAPTLVGEFDFVDTLRIIGNLLDNAIRHTAPRGVIDLEATREDGWIAFTVADRGPGVDPLERARIFDAFYRPASALPDSGHAGLGLSIAKALAEAQGGALEYRDRDGGGSTFVLRLPAAEVSDGDGAELE